MTNWETPRLLEQSLVSPGLRRTPHADRDSGEVFHSPNLAQDVFASVLGEVQVHQDQVRNGCIRIGSLPADEGEGFAAVQQVNQFIPEILLLQRPLEKEDVRAVVFNDKNPGCGNNRSVHQSHSQRPTRPTIGGTGVCGDTCRALTTKRLGAAPIYEKG